MFEPTETSNQLIICYLGHVIGYKPTMDQHFLIRSVPATYSTDRRVEQCIQAVGDICGDRTRCLCHQSTWMERKNLGSVGVRGGKIQFTPGTDRNKFTKQLIRTRYLGHVTGYQPIRGQYSLIRSVPDSHSYLFSV
eukprot:sb/3474592/